MGNTLISELIASGACKAYWDLRTGSLLDASGNGNTLTVVGAPTPGRTRKGAGVFFPHAGDNELLIGNPVSLQLSTLTLFAAVARQTTKTAQYHSVFGKDGAYLFAFNGGAEPYPLQEFDFGGGVARTSTFTCYPDGGAHWVAASIQSGIALGSTFYADGASQGTFTLTVANQLADWRLGNYIGLNSSLGGVILVAGICNRVLASQEHSRLWDDFVNGPMQSADCCRRNFVYVNKGGNDAWYNAQGIVLDTDFASIMVGATRKIADKSPSNYVGTINGTPTPGAGGQGMVCSKNTDFCAFGDVTQFNAVQHLSLEMAFDFPNANFIGEFLFGKIVDGTHRVSMYTGAGSPAQVTLEVSDGVAHSAISTNNVLRKGTRQHMTIVFNGPGAADADRYQLYVDGDAQPITFTNPMIAQTPNLAGVQLYEPYQNHAFPSTHLGTKLYTGSLTAAQVRAAYLQNFAQRLTLRETFEDVPVTLAASVGAGGYIGQWRVMTGTWKCSETSDGKRWLECVTAGCVVMPQPDAFGSAQFIIQKVDATGTSVVEFEASQPAAFSTAGQNGYLMLFTAAGLLEIAKYTNGALVSDIVWTVAGYAALSTTYQFLINRRPSDGRFTWYIKGGAYTNWTLVSVVGGGGTNPSAGDATYTTSAWFSLNLRDGDKLLLYDPKDPTVGLMHYQGVLDPTAGEIP